MSLMKTLTKVAIGIVVAKGVKHVTSGGGSTRRASKPASGMGGIMEEILGAGKTSRRPRRAPAGSARGKTGSSTLDDILGSFSGTGTGRSRKSAPKGGLGDLLGGGRGSGGLGDLLGAVLGGATGQVGGMTTPSAEAEDEAEAAVLLRAMIMAAKCDGQLDAKEKAVLMEAVGQATKAEIDFINRELAAPLDMDSLLQDVPRGLEEKVYMASVMAITLDDRAEAEYLHELAQALGLSATEVNALHDHLQAPRIYR
jgi:hypothetical protein